LALALVALCVWMLTGCGSGAATPAPVIPAGLPATVAVSSEMAATGGGVPLAGERAPDFTYRMVDGDVRSLSALRGRKVLVNFWATWCVPCKEEMPDLQRLADEYGERVAVLGVNKLEALEAIGPFAADLGITFTLVANPEGDIAQRYGAKNLPTTYFINSDGTVGAVHIGVLTYDEAKAEIKRLR
jgi:thiol-disulfide isomerase/thioredoxin